MLVKGAPGLIVLIPLGEGWLLGWDPTDDTVE